MSSRPDAAAPVRVAYVLKRFPRLSQTFVLEEMLELERQGAELVVVAARESGEGVEHPRVRALRAPVLRPGTDPGAIADLLRTHRVEHVHAHFASSAAETARQAARLAGIPYSFTAHATDIFRRDVDHAALVRRIVDAAFVVTVTDENRRHLCRLLDARGEGGRVIRLYNGVDVSRLTAGRGGPDGGVLTVGRMVPKKGFGDFLRAVAVLRDRGRPVRATILGDGPERAGLEQLRDDLGIAGLVDMPGACDSDQVLDRLRRASVFALACVVTSDGDRDALPTVILEAMAVGTPVVSTAISGIPEMIENGRSGLLVPPNDPAALAEAIGFLGENQALAEEFAAAARVCVEERFSLSRNVATLHRLFRGEPAP